jgi:hypothetical protein
VPQDYAKAVAWYQKAADQGDAQAQNNLGAMYRAGQGVPQNDVAAYALYNLSAAKNSTASSNRDNLAKLLTEPQIEAAQALTQRMQTVGILKALTSHIKTAAVTRTPIRPEHHAAPRENITWPARPAKQAGVTACNTRCVNGSCWRTYDNGRHVFLNVAPSIDPFSNEMKFNAPPC